MSRKKRYVVWMAFINYTMAINEKNVIAIFYSRNRAEEYVKMCKEADHDNNTIYGID